MYPNILSPEQLEIIPLMQDFKKEFYLVGGTAIALQIGHRKSIDFDMFKATSLNTKRILDKIDQNKYKYTVTRRVQKIFCAQLAFHKDINYIEEVEYMPGYFVDEQEIKGIRESVVGITLATKGASRNKVFSEIRTVTQLSLMAIAKDAIPSGERSK